MALHDCENNQDWKAFAYSEPLGRGEIAAVSGQVRLGDGLDIQLHPELWGKISINLLDPLTPEIIDSPSYMKSINLVGVVDGSYIFPDLPSTTVKLQAVSDGWQSSVVTVDLSANYAYRPNVDFIMYPL